MLTLAGITIISLSEESVFFYVTLEVAKSPNTSPPVFQNTVKPENVSTSLYLYSNLKKILNLFWNIVFIMNFVLPLNVNKKNKKTDSSELMQETSRTVCFFQHYMLVRVLGIRSLRDPVSPFNGVLTKPYCSVWSFQNHITSSLGRECIYMHTLLWKVCSDRKQKPCIICTNMTARFLFRSASDWIQKSPLSSWLFSFLSVFFFLVSLYIY